MRPGSNWPDAQAARGELIDQFLGEAATWVFAAPGVTTRTDDTLSSTAGLKFISEQLKMNGSKFRMPKSGATHRDWEDWFLRISSFCLSCPSIDPTLLISTLTATIDRDDRRIYGWYHEGSEAVEQGDGSFKEFVAHVRKQVLSSNTTRREAAEQLAALVNNTDTVPDCVAMGTKLKQLFSQMYPVGLSQEPEPTTRRLAVLDVHKLLQNLKHRKRKGSPSQSVAELHHL